MSAMKSMAITSSLPIVVEELLERKEKPEGSDLGFGKQFTDRMLQASWRNGSWSDFRIKAYEPMTLEPSTVVFHYGQAIFEGMKAYRHSDGSVHLFRPEQNAKRFNSSAKRMVMPEVDEEIFVEGIRRLVELEKDWVPSEIGSSLYIRPTMIASEPVLGVKPSNEYMFFVILSPSGSYFSKGFQPTRIKVEDKYVRAAEGGTGNVKASSNYAGSLLASKLAKEEGYDQVLWLDAKERKYIEEVGSMNIAFVIDGVIHTPAPRGTILDGITRRSVVELARWLDLEVSEDRITIDFIIESIRNGELTEIFGIGTAAVISPVGELGYGGEDFVIGDGTTGPISDRLFKALTGIQYGIEEDIFDWMTKVA